jgi:septal ring factor EnvC (AmiA/AmiB activator)
LEEALTNHKQEIISLNEVKLEYCEQNSNLEKKYNQVMVDIKYVESKNIDLTRQLNEFENTNSELQIKFNEIQSELKEKEQELKDAEKMSKEFENEALHNHDLIVFFF